MKFPLDKSVAPCYANCTKILSTVNTRHTVKPCHKEGVETVFTGLAIMIGAGAAIFVAIVVALAATLNRK